MATSVPDGAPETAGERGTRGGPSIRCQHARTLVRNKALATGRALGPLGRAGRLWELWAVRQPPWPGLRRTEHYTVRRAYVQAKGTVRQAGRRQSSFDGRLHVSLPQPPGPRGPPIRSGRVGSQVGGVAPQGSWLARMLCTWLPPRPRAAPGPRSSGAAARWPGMCSGLSRSRRDRLDGGARGRPPPWPARRHTPHSGTVCVCADALRKHPFLPGRLCGQPRRRRARLACRSRRPQASGTVRHAPLRQASVESRTQRSRRRARGLRGAPIPCETAPVRSVVSRDSHGAQHACSAGVPSPKRHTPLGPGRRRALGRREQRLAGLPCARACRAARGRRWEGGQAWPALQHTLHSRTRPAGLLVRPAPSTAGSWVGTPLSLRPSLRRGCNAPWATSWLARRPPGSLSRTACSPS